jgi:hypothetical protein
MDMASAYGAGDCGFESRWGHIFCARWRSAFRSSSCIGLGQSTFWGARAWGARARTRDRTTSLQGTSTMPMSQLSRRAGRAMRRRCRETWVTPPSLCVRWRRSTGQHSQQKWQMVASIPRACCICDGRICCGAARPTACLCTGKVTNSEAVRKAPAHMSRRRTRMCEAQRLPPRRHMLRSQHMGARYAISTCKFARVVKGVDLRSTAGNCAWVRAPQLAIDNVQPLAACSWASQVPCCIGTSTLPSGQRCCKH